MCVKDLQIGEQTHSRPWQYTIPATAESLVLGPSAARIGVGLGVGLRGVVGTSEYVAIGPLVDGVVQTIAAISQNTPYTHIRLQDAGQVIRGELHVQSAVAADCPIIVTDFFITSPLSEL